MGYKGLKEEVYHCVVSLFLNLGVIFSGMFQATYKY